MRCDVFTHGQFCVIFQPFFEPAGVSDRLAVVQVRRRMEGRHEVGVRNGRVPEKGPLRGTLLHGQETWLRENALLQRRHLRGESVRASNHRIKLAERPGVCCVDHLLCLVHRDHVTCHMSHGRCHSSMS